jgi:membrane associated rhomboid family serine protease
MIPLKDDTPSSGRPYVTISLIAACCGLFLWQRSLDPGQGRQVVDALGAIPAVLMTNARLPQDLQWIPRYATRFTSMFLHGGWMHLLGNMLFLWIYGDNVEDGLGHLRFLLFYSICGIAAVFAQALGNPGSPYPIIGASGAISGVLGAYMLLLLWFAAQLVGDFAVSGAGTSVAFGAHIGGFLTGMLLAPMLKRRTVKLFAS